MLLMLWGEQDGRELPLDIGVAGKDALRLVALALKHGMTGIGLSQKGDYTSRYCHMDDLTEGVRPHTWTY